MALALRIRISETKSERIQMNDDNDDGDKAEIIELLRNDSN